MIKNYFNDVNLDNCLLFFANKDCFPCKLLEEELKELNIDIYKIDISKELKTAQDFNVKSIPTLMFMKNGKNIFTTTGVRSLKDLNKILLHFNMI